MSVRFLTNIDKQLIDEQIDSLSKCADGSVVISEIPPENTNALWVDITDTSSDNQQNGTGGGNYGIELDTTLTISGKAADAGAVGEKFSELNEVNAALDRRIIALEQGSSSGGDTPAPNAHGIIWDLINVTSNNPITSISHGASLVAMLVVSVGYTLGDVTITMGGEVVTGAWNADTATVTIMNVTDDVIISAVATELAEVDTSPVIAQYDVGFKQFEDDISTIEDVLGSREGVCITKIYPYEPDVEAIKASNHYDAENDYLNTAGISAKFTCYTPSLKGREAGYSPSTSGASKIVRFLDEVPVSYHSNASLTASSAPTEYSNGCVRYNQGAMYANGISFTLMTMDVDDSYAYWVECDFKPIGVRAGDIIFAGKNTPYYGMLNIDGTKPNQTAAELTYDDDYAQDYGIATVGILGEETNSNPSVVYGVSAEMAAAIDEARTAWMIEYGGDYRKVPIIVSTDQHGRRNAGIWNMLGKVLSMYDISRVMNLGDTTNWTDADTEHPLLSCSTLESWCDSVKAIPYSKQLNVFGNHDTWYENYTDEGNPIGTRYPSSQAHLYQYFRNIYPHRLNNNGWFVNYDDAFNVKYVVVSGFEYKDGASAWRMSTAQMTWLIAELEKDDGYNVVIVSHVPLHYKTEEMLYPFPYEDTTPNEYRLSNVDTDALFANRKTGGSGTITDSDGVEHTYDFSKVRNSPILCAIHGHTHLDVYNYVGGELLSYAFDWFDDDTFFFALIDSVNNRLNIWKVSAPSGAPMVENYQVPFDPYN